jgi:uncharacterized protein YndB with AHSA1/START domain
MSELPVQISASRRFDQSPERVFDAWLDPGSAGEWLFATSEGEMERVEIDPRVGGSLTIVERRGEQQVWHHGRYVEIDRPRRLAFRFSTDPEDPNPSLVTVGVAPEGDGCRLTLTHDMEAKWADGADHIRHGWETILGNLASAL